MSNGIINFKVHKNLEPDKIINSKDYKQYYAKYDDFSEIRELIENDEKNNNNNSELLLDNTTEYEDIFYGKDLGECCINYFSEKNNCHCIIPSSDDFTAFSMFEQSMDVYQGADFIDKICIVITSKNGTNDIFDDELLCKYLKEHLFINFKKYIYQTIINDDTGIAIDLNLNLLLLNIFNKKIKYDYDNKKIIIPLILTDCFSSSITNGRIQTMGDKLFQIKIESNEFSNCILLDEKYNFQIESDCLFIMNNETRRQFILNSRHEQIINIESNYFKFNSHSRISEKKIYSDHHKSTQNCKLIILYYQSDSQNNLKNDDMFDINFVKIGLDEINFDWNTDQIIKYHVDNINYFVVSFDPQIENKQDVNNFLNKKCHWSDNFINICNCKKISIEVDDDREKTLGVSFICAKNRTVNVFY
jgi:hypothetical protein